MADTIISILQMKKLRPGKAQKHTRGHATREVWNPSLAGVSVLSALSQQVRTWISGKAGHQSNGELRPHRVCVARFLSVAVRGLVRAVVWLLERTESGVMELETFPGQGTHLALGTQWQIGTRPCLLPENDISTSTNK